MIGNIVAYLDTMVFLHYPDFTGLDWCKILDAEDVELIIPSVILYELDEHKDKHPNGNIRKRVRKLLSKIEELVGDDTTARVTDHIKLTVILEEPPAEFENEGLSKDVKDDQLIMSMIGYRRQYPDERIVVVSGDSPVRLKSKKRGFICVKPPEDLRTDPVSEHELQIENLQKELQRLQSSKPNVTIGFPTGKNHMSVTVPKSKQAEDEYITAKFNAVLEKYQTIATYGSETTYRAISPFNGPSYKDALKYNEKLHDYYAQYKEYERRVHSIHVLVEQLVPLNVQLLNSGGQPATEVWVKLTLQGGIRFYTPDTLPEFPEEPEPPAKPTGVFYGALQFASPNVNLLEQLYDLRQDLHRDKGKDLIFVSVSDDGKCVEYQVMNLMQHRPSLCPEIYLSLEDPNRPLNFSIAATIIVSEIPDPIATTLHIKCQPDSTTTIS
jgi:hypothetical protein